MDKQELAQLRDFDEQVLAHAENAAFFATNGFLTTLSHLLDASINDNGQVKVLKDVLKGFATVYPYIFETLLVYKVFRKYENKWV